MFFAEIDDNPAAVFGIRQEAERDWRLNKLPLLLLVGAVALMTDGCPILVASVINS